MILNPRRAFLTRTALRSESSSARLQDHGFKVTKFPALETVAFKRIIWPATPDALAVIFTSPNGITHAPEDLRDHATLCICVGDATAQLAKQNGYDAVDSASGNSTDVIELVNTRYSKNAYEFWHLGHSNPRGDIVGNLKKAGHRAHHIPTYTTRENPDFEDAFVKWLLSSEADDIVLVYSPAAAEIIAPIIQHHKHANAPKVICISAHAAYAFRLIDDLEILVSQHPTEESLFDTCLSS